MIMKKNILKSITKLFGLTVLVGLSITSCAYDEFVENEFDLTVVYLAKPTIDRTFIMGEGLKIGVGATLGGRLTNTEDVEITFSLVDSVVTNAALTILPSTHYELVDADGNPANNKIIIPAGEIQGFVYVKADSINLLEDALSLGNNYALNFQLDNVVNADSILVEQNSSMITFSYINKLFGNYFQNGEVVKTEGAVVETIPYSGFIENAIEFTMIDPNTLLCNAMGDRRGGSFKMNVVLASDNSITIETATGGLIVVDDGDSYYDPTSKTMMLNYSYEYLGANYVAKDVLLLRNRLVDGVNQPNYDLQ